jgi:2-dehydro-3-deoxyphosphogluconate aldolase / (4S)-4-hydroxy-2-oxoglutarate aldolase
MLNILKYRVLDAIEREGIIGIVRDTNEQDALVRSRALIAGGVSVLEISLSTPGAFNILTQLIHEIREQNQDVFIGAGTVLDSESARFCIANGAQFIIAPDFNAGLVKTCHRYGILCIPGTGTVTEIVTAMENGIDAVKVFPGSVMGPEFIKAVSGPLPHANCIPVGGVNIDNIGDWFRAGSFAVALGAGLTHPVKNGCSFEEIKAHAGRVIEKVKAEKQ